MKSEMLQKVENDFKEEFNKILDNEKKAKEHDVLKGYRSNYSDWLEGKKLTYEILLNQLENASDKDGVRIIMIKFYRGIADSLSNVDNINMVQGTLSATGHISYTMDEIGE